MGKSWSSNKNHIREEGADSGQSQRDINAETEVESPRLAFPLEQERGDEEVLGADVFC